MIRTVTTGLGIAALVLSIAGCESGKKDEEPRAKAPAADSGGYEWVIKAREAEATDPSSAPDAFSRGGKDALPFLIWMLTSDDTPQAMRAADALVKLGPDAVDALDQVVRSKAKHGRNWAAWALGKIGPPAKSALPGIEELGKQAQFKQVAAEAKAGITR